MRELRSTGNMDVVLIVLRRWPSASHRDAHPFEFIDENGGGPGVRLRKRHQKKS
jgi:hypothetical protein